MLTAETFDQQTKEISNKLDPEVRSTLGQFMTPSAIAEFMVSFFSRKKKRKNIRLLEAGAGTGSLIIPFIRSWQDNLLKSEELHLDAIETDEKLINHLQDNLTKLHGLGVVKNKLWTARYIQDDFIQHAVDQINSGTQAGYTHAILNPPYKKIAVDSAHRNSIKSAGFVTVNLYAAFVGLAIMLLQKEGELVAIIPRSFCNGPYYRSFRDLIFEQCAIKHIHLFNSRHKAFEDVLQENIIIYLVKGRGQADVTISSSYDSTLTDYIAHRYTFKEIVNPADKQKFIHVPDEPDKLPINLREVGCVLDSMGLKVSTGPVIDFRVKQYLRKKAWAKNSVPLLYPNHFSGLKTSWPLDSKKPNSINDTEATRKWLYPNGYYVVVRRFSAKEEKKRIVASVYNPYLIKAQKSDWVGFENHLNVIHKGKQGLTKEIAYGLAVFLSATVVDHFFRQFNGHTQVNATDLRNIRYPDIAYLLALGEWCLLHQLTPTQEQIDEQLKSFFGEA